MKTSKLNDARDAGFFSFFSQSATGLIWWLILERQAEDLDSSKADTACLFQPLDLQIRRPLDDVCEASFFSPFFFFKTLPASSDGSWISRSNGSEKRYGLKQRQADRLLVCLSFSVVRSVYRQHHMTRVRLTSLFSFFVFQNAARLMVAFGFICLSSKTSKSFELQTENMGRVEHITHGLAQPVKSDLTHTIELVLVVLVS